jgi:hypothetical protein
VSSSNHLSSFLYALQKIGFPSLSPPTIGSAFGFADGKKQGYPATIIWSYAEDDGIVDYGELVNIFLWRSKNEPGRNQGYDRG